ncbi:hypothetical protein AAHC03_013982 [Spirometra sp. Aus1]
MAGRLDVKRIESRLIEYQSKAQEMSVGVNYAALDNERQRQEDLLRELHQLEEEISSPLLSKTQLPELASSVGVDLDLNTKCLQYLTEISELERCVSDVTAQFAERSVELSNPNAVHSAVYTYKTLTDNVESCWEYVDQLASLAQIHLKSAAQYHQFFHEANELESKMERQLIIAENRQELTPGRRIYKETSKLANEIREQLDNMRNLWDRSKALVDRSSHIVPMRLRLGGVAKGMTVGTRTERPVMVRAMTGLMGPNYSIQQGEHLRLIDNRDDVRLWKVQTSTGIVNVPSVCFWLTGNDIEATNRAIAIKKKCRTVWLDLLERNRKRLYENFTVIMTQLASEENLYCTNYDALNDLLQDMSLLLPTSGLNDGRLQAAVDRFRRKVIMKNDMERIPTSGLVLQEPDLVRMRAPLLRLRDHLEGIRKMEAELKIIDERISEYLSEVDNEREQVYNSIELLESLTEKSQTQLKDLLEELGQWRRSSPVQEVRMRYIRAPKSKHRMEYYPELAEAPQTPLGRFRSQSQPGQEPPRGRHKSPHHAKDSEYRRARSAVSKTDVMTQIGMQSKQAETQYNSQQDLTAWQRTSRGEGDIGQVSADKRSKSTQRSLNGPTQLSVMTQIGCESKEFGNQVDKVMLRALDAEPNDYINPEDAKLQHSAPKNGKYVNSALQCRLSDGKLRTAVQQVNSCTQQGFVKRDQACSPTRAPSGECPLCHQPEPGRIRRRTGERYYDTAETLYSGTEMQAMSEFYQISEEPSNYSSDVLVCKRIQAGYPSLHPKENLYTQVDVYKNAEDVEVGDSVAPGGTKRIQTTRNPDMNSYAQITVRPIHDNLVASTQIGVVQKHRASSPHRELLPVQVASESYALEQAHMISADVEELATQPGRRNIRAQAGYPTLTNQRSASTMIFRNSMEPIPEIAETSTQNGPIVTATYVQTTEPMLYVTSEREKNMVSKRTQMGYTRFGPLCDSFAQIGSVYSQKEIQTLPIQQPMIQPEPQHLVQAPVPDDGPIYAEAGAMTRAASVPEICVSSTQVGAMVAHERLSPITTEISAESKRTQAGHPCLQPKMHSWLQCTVIASDKSALTDEVVGHTELNVQSVAEAKAEMVNKKFQAMMAAYDSEIQVGRLYCCNAAQTIEVQAEQELIARPIAIMECQAMQEVESTRVAQIAEVAQYAPVPVLPEVASAEAQAAPIYHGKKLQVAVQPALCELATEPVKGHNKKMQVSIELRPEHFDVSCDAVIKPDTSSKKIQVEEMEPVIQMPTRIEPVFAPAPSPAPSMHEASCDCRPRLGILQAQTEPAIPTHGKKLQVNLQEEPPVMQESSCSAKQSPHVYDASVQITPLPPPIEKSHGKKLQVDLIVTPEPIQMVSTLLQTDEPSVQDSAADPCPGKELFDAGVQISTPEPVVVAEPIPVVHAAPPEPTIEYSDTGCDAMPRVGGYDAFAQVEPEPKAPSIGKKLQVKPPPLDTSTCQTDMAVKPQLAFTGTQCVLPKPSNVGIQIEPLEKPVEPIAPEQVTVVHSAPPAPLVETEDAACDPVQKEAGYDVFTQAEPVPVEKPPQHGKKLQVNPRAPEIASCQTAQYVEKIPYGIMGTQCAPQPKVETFGKKLQVRLSALDTSSCQTELVEKPVLATDSAQCPKMKLASLGIQIEMLEPVPEIVPLQPTQVVHAAPPAAETEDRACDAIEKKESSDAFIQVEPPSMAEVGCAAQPPIPQHDASVQSEPEPKPQVLGKKLQVRTLSLDNKDCQTDVEKPPEPVKVSSLGVQVESVEPPVDVVAVKATPVVHAAPPIPVAPTDDRACDAIVREKGFDVFTQSDKIPEPDMIENGCLALPKLQYKDTEMQAEPESQPIKIGKKLQVKTLTLSTSQCQTEVARPLVMATAQCEPVKTTGMGVQVDKIEEPQPVIAPTVVTVERTAPPVPAIETEDRACDAILKEKGSDSYTQCDLAPQITMVNAESVPIPPVSLEYISVQTQPEPKPITIGKKLQVHTTVLATTQAQTDVVPQVVKPLLISTQTQCIPKQMTACGVQIESAEPQVQVIAAKAVPVVHAAPPIPIVKTEDRSCDAIVREKGFDVFTQSDPIRGPDMVSDGCEAIVPTAVTHESTQCDPEAKPITLGKKLQVHTTVLATTQAQTDVVPQVVKPPLVSTQTQCIPKQMTACGVQIESAEPQVQVIAAKAVPVVHAAPPIPVVKTEDRSCDAIVREKGFDVFTQSDPIRGPDMVSDGCEAIVPEAKPITLGKKLQVQTTVLATTQAQTAVVPQVVKPLLVSTQTQCIPKQMTACGVQIESAEPQVQVIAAKAVPVVHAAPPMPVVKTEDRSCDAIVREKGFDIFTQSDPIRGPDMVSDGCEAIVPTAVTHESTQCDPEAKPITLGKKLQVHTTVLATTQAQRDVVPQVVKPLLVSTQTQCIPKQMTACGVQIESAEPQVQVIAAKAVPVVHAAPPIPVVKTEDRSCDAIVREKGFDIFTQSDPIRGPDMVSDGCEAIVPTAVTHESTQCDPEAKPITLGKKLQVHTTVLATTQAQTDVVPQVVKPPLVSTQTQCIPKQMTACGVQIESAEPQVQVIAAKAVPVVHAAPPIPVVKTEDRSCDAIVREKGFDIFTQSDPIRGPDMVDDGVSALTIATKPITFGKKMQVEMSNLTVAGCQTHFVLEAPKPTISLSSAQCQPTKTTSLGIQIEKFEEPPAVVAPTVVTVQRSAPPVPVAETEDRSCDAIVREKGFDIFTQSDPIRGPDMVSDGCEAIVPTAVTHESTQCDPEAKPITLGKKLQVHTTVLATTQAQTDVVPQVVKPPLVSTQTQCIPKQMTACGVQIESAEPQVQVIAAKAVPVVHAAPPIPVVKTEDRSCDAIVREKGFDVFTQSDPIRGPDMVSDGCEAIVPEAKPITLGKKLQVQTTVLATTQAQTAVVPQVVKPLLVSTQTQCIPKQMTACGVQIESAEPQVQVIAAKAVPVVHAAPPMPVVKTEDRSCDAIVREKGFDIFTQSDPIRGPDMVSDGCEAIVPTAVTHESTQCDPEAKPITLGKKLQVHTTVLATTQAQTDVVPQVVKPLLVSTQTQCIPKQMTACGVQIESAEPQVQVIAAKAVPVVHAAPPIPVVKTEDRSCDAIVREKGFDIFTQSDPIRGPDMVDDGVSALPIETKPITFGKKMQVEMSNLTVAGCQTHFVLEAPKPTFSLSSAQCQPTKTTSLGIQIEKFEEPPAVVAPTVVTVQRSAPPVPVAETEDRSCDAIMQERGFDVFTQSVPVFQPTLLSKNVQVSPPILTNTQMQSDVRPIEQKPVLASATVQCLPIESPVGVVAVKALPVVHAAPPLSAVEMEDRGCDAIPRPHMVEDGCAALAPPEVRAPTFGKKMQVNLTVLDTTQSQTKMPYISTTVTSDIFNQVAPVRLDSTLVQASVQPAPTFASKTILVDSASQSLPPTLSSLGVQVEGIQEPATVIAPVIAPVVKSAPPLQPKDTEDRGCDAVAGLQYCDAFVQSEVAAPTVAPLLTSSCQSELITRPTYVYVTAQCVNIGTSDLTEPAKTLEVPADFLVFRKAQTISPVYGVQGTQVAVTEPIVEVPVQSAPALFSAPPMQPQIETRDSSCDAPQKPQSADVFVQARPSQHGKKLQVSPEPLCFTACQTGPLDYVDSRLRLQSDMFIQVELPPKRPPCRGVRIQAGLPATSPRVQAQKRDGYVQSTPVVMVGTTQTFDQEEAPVVRAVEQTKVESAPPAKLINDDNIFSFTRETVARVTRGARKSPGLIPYKTQVFATPKQLSASMPAQLNVRVDAANTTISTTEQLTYQQAPISSNLPRRYANRLRSPTARNFYTRRNRSAENIDGYENYVSRGMSRNFVSDYEIYTGNTCDHCSEHSRVQQSGVEQRCAATLDAYVRRLGYETVHHMLVEVARALELEEMEVTSYASHYSSKRPRLQDARTQYTSTTSLMNAYPGIYTPSSFSERSYKSSKSIQEGNSFVQWTPLQPGEQVSIVYQSELSAEEEISFFGEDGTDSTERIGKKLLGWIRKAEPLTKYQLEAARPRLETSSDEFMKSRALSAYCSDAELQESRIKTNYSAYDAFTLVAWKANDRGDGRLELSTLGRLLKLTLVGARLPGSGDIISAAEAFYRGILRIVYFDEENSNILSLPAAINTSNVIVEKQYPPGVGIALRGDQDRYPVEAEVVWTTPELRHRSYKVNYIRKSETEKIDVLTALDEGVIDQYSGEIVNVSLGPSAVLGEPIHEARESSVGSGDTVIRRQKPERFSINEAILNDILNVEFDGQETIAPIAATTEDIQDPSGSKSGSAEPSEVDI